MVKLCRRERGEREERREKREYLASEYHFREAFAGCGDSDNHHRVITPCHLEEEVAVVVWLVEEEEQQGWDLEHLRAGSGERCSCFSRIRRIAEE